MPQQNPNCVFDLSQNPWCRPCLASNGCLPTLRCSSKLWSCYLSRWLLDSELSLCMGLPVSAGAAKACASSMVSAPSRKFLGNGMHLFNVGAVMIVTLGSLMK